MIIYRHNKDAKVKAKGTKNDEVRWWIFVIHIIYLNFIWLYIL